jgi:hypothetical protein
MAIRTETDADEPQFPVSCATAASRSSHDGGHFPVAGAQASHSIYFEGEDRGQFGWVNSAYDYLVAPRGTMLPLNRTAYGMDGAAAEDLDPGDPDYASLPLRWSLSGDIAVAGQDDMSSPGKAAIRFMDVILSDKKVCSTCSGKGWVAASGRAACPVCGGERFEDVYVDGGGERLPVLAYGLSRYEPLERWLAPLSRGRRSAPPFGGQISSRQTLFMYDSKRNSASWEAVGDASGRTVQEDCPSASGGVNPRFDAAGHMAVKTETAVEDPHAAPFQGVLGESVGFGDHVSPAVGEIGHGMTEYVPGYSPSEAPGFCNRVEPTNRWERGLYRMGGGVWKSADVQKLGMAYLQPEWDSYNLLHWRGTMGATTSVQLQVCRLLEDGSSTEYVDVILDGASFDMGANAWLATKGAFYDYWDTIGRQGLEPGFDYKMRIRQYDKTSNTFSSWVGSSKFKVGGGAPAAPNVISCEYEPWTGRLVITYSIDDVNGNMYNVMGLWYSVGGDFLQVSMGDVMGDTDHLDSRTSPSAQGGVHKLVWAAKGYISSPTQSCRVAIEIVPSKIVDGMSPPRLSFSADYNPAWKTGDDGVVSLSGKTQYYHYNPDTGETSVLAAPVRYPGGIDLSMSRIEEFKSYPPPSGLFAFLDASGNVADGAGYEGWMSAAVIPGVTRRDRLMDMEQELSGMIDGLPAYVDMRLDALSAARERLIDQGFYCNGFNGNSPEGGVFDYRVLSGASGLYDPRCQVYCEFQLDPDPGFASASGEPFRTLLFDKSGSRIHSDDTTITSYSVPSGTVESVVDNNSYLWAGEVMDTGGDAEAEGEEAQKERIYTTLTIPMAALPGEASGDLPPFGGSYAGEYLWRARSYNLVTADDFSSASPEILSRAMSGSSLSVYFALWAPKGAGTFNMSKLEFRVSSSGAYLYDEAAVEWPTDPPSGHEDELDVWTPLSRSRSRPSVVKTSGMEYFMWYSKTGSRGEPTLLHARAMSPSRAGERSLALPMGRYESLQEKFGISAAHSPCVAKFGSRWGMWFSAVKDGLNAIHVSWSEDASSWGDPVQVSGLPAGYSPWVSVSGSVATMCFARASGGLSVLSFAESLDGEVFSSTLDAGFGGGMDLTSPCMFGGKLYYTGYSGSSPATFVRDASASGWGAESMLASGVYNLSALADSDGGDPATRVYYNRSVDGDDRIFTAVLRGGGWTLVSSNPALALSGDVTGISGDWRNPSVRSFTVLDNGYVSAAYKALERPQDALFRISFAHTSQRVYSLSSDWVGSSNAASLGADASPGAFVYDPAVKYFDWGDDF